MVDEGLYKRTLALFFLIQNIIGISHLIIRLGKFAKIVYLTTNGGIRSLYKTKQDQYGNNK
ncbi:hypothetical protein BH10BAC1_BH10BAC1_03800 [soil metagenome]